MHLLCCTALQQMLGVLSQNTFFDVQMGYRYTHSENAQLVRWPCAIGHNLESMYVHDHMYCTQHVVGPQCICRGQLHASRHMYIASTLYTQL